MHGPSWSAVARAGSPGGGRGRGGAARLKSEQERAWSQKGREGGWEPEGERLAEREGWEGKELLSRWFFSGGFFMHESTHVHVQQGLSLPASDRGDGGGDYCEWMCPQRTDKYATNPPLGLLRLVEMELS